MLSRGHRSRRRVIRRDCGGREDTDFESAVCTCRPALTLRPQPCTRGSTHCMGVLSRSQREYGRLHRCDRKSDFPIRTRVSGLYLGSSSIWTCGFTELEPQSHRRRHSQRSNGLSTTPSTSNPLALPHSEGWSLFVRSVDSAGWRGAWNVRLPRGPSSHNRRP